MSAFRSTRAQEALRQGTWVKLICGASNQDLPSIADLCAVYAVAGVHCVDVAADAAVVRAARAGLAWASAQGAPPVWLMVSVSDGSDAHFRKAQFDPRSCPADCPRPCMRVCPAEAIAPLLSQQGVDPNRCYGCGRCLPACPFGLIEAHNHLQRREDLAALVAELRPDAIEVHTAPGRAQAFAQTIEALVAAKQPLHRLAVSCGLEGHGLTPTHLAKELWQRHAVLRSHGLHPLWQLDGRPMSGDVGRGTARSAIHLWQQMLPLAPPGPLQLAGGTNARTWELLQVGERSGGLQPAGVAFGGQARALVQPWLQRALERGQRLVDWPEGWTQALDQARTLVDPWLQAQGAPPSC
ncbi:MAG: LdpA C-terminal domain-containing domain [Synechococcus sp.]|nr:LdpA C-terminal domain-containing domain [Synechococcus sp.]